MSDKQKIVLFEGPQTEAWNLGNAINAVVLDPDMITRMMFGPFNNLINKNMAKMGFYELMEIYLIENMSVIIYDKHISDEFEKQVEVVSFQICEDYGRSIEVKRHKHRPEPVITVRLESLKLKKPMEDFVQTSESGEIDYVLSSDLKKIFYAKDLKRLNKFLFGQTALAVGGESGIYPWDLERFINGLPVID